jgi:hypothetical protein
MSVRSAHGSAYGNRTRLPGFRKDDPNDTIKAKILLAEWQAKKYQGFASSTALLESFSSHGSNLSKHIPAGSIRRHWDVTA